MNVEPDNLSHLKEKIFQEYHAILALYPQYPKMYLLTIVILGNRGEGNGTHAMKYLINWCRTHGYKLLILSAMYPGVNHPEYFRDYQRLCRWYERLGFTNTFGTTYEMIL